MLVRHALKTAIATALLGAVLQGSEQIAYFVYPVMGLITTMQSSLGSTVKAAWGRLGGSTIGGLIGAWLNSTYGASPVMGGLAFILSSLFCEVFLLQAPFNQAGTISALIAVSILGDGSNPWLYAFNRVFDNWIGVMIGIGVTLLFWPDNPRRTLLNNLIKVLGNSSQVFQAIVAIDPTADQESAIRNLLTEIKRTIQQSKSLLTQEMYGPVGNKLTEENWSDLLAAEGRLFRHLAVMLKTLQKSGPGLLSHQFTEPLVQIAQQVSAACAALTQVAQLTSASSGIFRFGHAIARNSTSVVPEIPILKGHLQSVTDQISWMRTTGTIKNYPIQQIRQFYVLLHGLKGFIQELDQLAIALVHRERIAAKPDVSPGLKLHPVLPERVKYILKTGVAVGLCLVVLNDWLHLPFNYYAIVAVIAAMQPTFVKSITAGRQRVIVTGVGAVFALCLIHTLGGNPFTLALGNALTILTCAYLGFGQGYVTGCILLTLSILGHGADPNGYIWSRFVETLIGSIIALILSELFWPTTAAQQLNQGIPQTLIKLGSLYEMLMSSYLQGTNLKAATTQLSREIQKSLQTHASLQTEAQQEPVHAWMAPRTQRLWNVWLSYEKELFENVRDLQDAVEQGTIVKLPQDLQHAMQVAAQATILSFNDLAAVAQQSHQQFFDPLPTFDAVEQALLKLHTSGGLSESLDQVISFVVVLLVMQEIAENLNQMVTDWISSSAQIGHIGY